MSDEQLDEHRLSVTSIYTEWEDLLHFYGAGVDYQLVSLISHTRDMGESAKALLVNKNKVPKGIKFYKFFYFKCMCLIQQKLNKINVCLWK